MCGSPSELLRDVGDFLGFDGEFGYQGPNSDGIVGEAIFTVSDGTTYLVPGDGPGDGTETETVEDGGYQLTDAEKALYDYNNDWILSHSVDFIVPTTITGVISYPQDGLPTPTAIGVAAYWQFWYDVATDDDIGEYNELATRVYAEHFDVYNPYTNDEPTDTATVN